MSRVTAIISAWLSASSSACHGLLIITVITPLPTKPSDKNARELKLANAAITDMQMRQRDVAALDAKYTKELLMLLKMMFCVMMLPLVVVGQHRKKPSSARGFLPALADNCLFRPDADGIYHFREIFDHWLQKQLEGT